MAREKVCAGCAQQIHHGGTTRRPHNAPVQHFHVKCAPPKAKRSRKAMPPHLPRLVQPRRPVLTRPRPLALYEAKEVAPGVWESEPEPIVAPSTALVRLNQAPPGPLVRLNQAPPAEGGSIVRFFPPQPPVRPTFPWASLLKGALLIFAGATLHSLSSRA